MSAIPLKTIERVTIYRRFLKTLLQQGKTHVFSHELAALAHRQPAQLRRDLMLIGYSGSPAKGYDIAALLDTMNQLLDHPAGQKLALVGIGNLGRAILSYFMGRRSDLVIAAAFDTDPAKTGRVISGCRCYPMAELDAVVRQEGITVGLITAPAAAAQSVADALVAAGVKAIVNWAPLPLRVPAEILVENRDITMSIEKAAYYAKSRS
jgi:redox-sensing transcriptional repressor